MCRGCWGAQLRATYDLKGLVCSASDCTNSAEYRCRGMCRGCWVAQQSATYDLMGLVCSADGCTNSAEYRCRDMCRGCYTGRTPAPLLDGTQLALVFSKAAAIWSRVVALLAMLPTTTLFYIFSSRNVRRWQQANLLTIYGGAIVPCEPLSNVSHTLASKILEGAAKLPHKLEVASALRRSGGWGDSDEAWAEHLRDTAATARQAEAVGAWHGLGKVAALLLATGDQHAHALVTEGGSWEWDARHAFSLEATIQALAQTSSADIRSRMINLRVEHPNKRWSKHELDSKSWVVGVLLVDGAQEVAVGGRRACVGQMLQLPQDKQAQRTAEAIRQLERVGAPALST